MTHDLKYILKRIVIGVGIILVLSFLRGIFILDVQAKEYPIPNYYMENTNNFCKDNQNRLQTNFSTLDNQCNAKDYASISLQYYSEYLPTIENEYPYFIQDNISDTGTYGDYEFNYRNLYNLVGISLNLSNRWQIKSNQEYSLLIRINKSDTMNYDTGNNELELENFRIAIRDNNSTIVINEYITIEKFQYQIGRNINNINSNNTVEGETNFNYILLNFKTGELPTGEGTQYFNTIALYFNKYVDIENVKYVPNNQSLYNIESTGTFDIKTTFIEGKTEFYGECEGDRCFYGIEYEGDLDIISGSDEELFQDYEECDNLDIACHVRNIRKGIDNLLVRIGNGIKGFFENITRAIQSLFIPNFEDMEQEVEEMQQVFNGKIGFIGDTFELLENLVDKFLDIENSNGIVNIPQINVPIFDRPIIQAQTWNLKEIFETGAIGTLYNIYKMFVSVILTLLMLNYFKREYDRVIRGGSKT